MPQEVDLDLASQQILAGYRDTALDDAERAADLLAEADSVIHNLSATEAQRDAALRRLSLACANADRSITHYFTQKDWALRVYGGARPSQPPAA